MPVGQHNYHMPQLKRCHNHLELEDFRQYFRNLNSQLPKRYSYSKLTIAGRRCTVVPAVVDNSELTRQGDKIPPTPSTCFYFSVVVDKFIETYNLKSKQLDIVLPWEDDNQSWLSRDTIRKGMTASMLVCSLFLTIKDMTPSTSL